MHKLPKSIVFCFFSNEIVWKNKVTNLLTHSIYFYIFELYSFSLKLSSTNKKPKTCFLFAGKGHDILHVHSSGVPDSLRCGQAVSFVPWWEQNRHECDRSVQQALLESLRRTFSGRNRLQPKLVYILNTISISYTYCLQL